MKKVLLIILFVLFSFKSFTQHQRGGYSSSDENYVVKINPLSLLFITGNLSFEYKVKNNLGAQLGVGYTMFNIASLKYEGIRLTPEFRFYPRGNALSGFYLAPYFRYQHYQLSEDINKLIYESFGGGLLFGWQKIYESGFIVDIFFGPSYNSGKFSVKEGQNTDPSLGFGINGTGLRTGLTIGFAF